VYLKDYVYIKKKRGWSKGMFLKTKMMRIAPDILKQ
jgi:hypothetical protein